MVRPSGDHVGDTSRIPGVEVRFRISPSFAGAVKISPCASWLTKSASASSGLLFIERMKSMTSRA